MKEERDRDRGRDTHVADGQDKQQKQNQQDDQQNQQDGQRSFAWGWVRPDRARVRGSK